MEQEELLKKIAGILEKLKIRYLITGGIAVVVWGRPRFTADIDIVIEILPQKLDSLAEELLQIDKEVYIDRYRMQRALKTMGEFNFIHPGAGLKIDFWILKNEAFDRERMRRRIRRKIAGTKIYLSSPEDLILIKLQWFKKTKSTRQLEDIESILAMQKRIDWKYLKKWAKNHSTTAILESIRRKNKL